MHQRHDDKDFTMMSEAVLAWYRFYEATPDDRASRVLCTAAIDFYNEGYCTANDLATILIGTYVGIYSTRVNASASQAIH